MKKTMVFENETAYDNWFDVNEEKEGGHDFLENRVVIIKETRTINGKKFNGFSADSTIECKNVRTAVRRFVKELNSNGFEVSIDDFESSFNGENLHDLTGSGMVVEVEEIDDDRYYVNYMCYQDEVEEEIETEETTEESEATETEMKTATDTETIEIETATETEPEITTEIEVIPAPEETAEETAKKTEIALDILIHGTTKTTEETTETKMTDSEVDYDVDMHIKSEKKSSCYWDSYTVKASTTDSAMDKALNRLMNEAGINKTSVDCIRVYKSGEPEILKECYYEAENEKIPDLNNFQYALIKVLGMTHAKEVRYAIHGVNVFFEFKGVMYKCYTPQSKLYKLTGQRFNLITWRDLKKEVTETDDNSSGIYTTRPPPQSSSAESVIK